MPTTSEPALNAALAEALRRRHPLWRDRVHVERTGILVESARRPDIVVDNPGGLPVFIETEIAPARTVEHDARNRVGRAIRTLSRVVEQVIAVRIPRDVAAVSPDAYSQVEAANLRYCAFSAAGDSCVRWPSEGWLSGGVSDLATSIELLSVSQSLLSEATAILELAVDRAAGLLDGVAWASRGDPIAGILHQASSEQTDRMAMAILANAVIFHNVIAPAHGLKRVRELRGALGQIAPALVEKSWEHVLEEINYWPIFAIALRLLRTLEEDLGARILNEISEAADELSGIGVTRLHDMSGRMFERLIADRKFLATFYTLPVSAALLSELAVPRLDADWGDRTALESLRIADLACGTGILLSAAYHAVLRRYRRAGGDDEALHPGMMETSLIAADIMPAATHLAASMLSSAHPGITFGNTCVYTLPYGKRDRPGQRKVSIGALDLFDSGDVGHLFGTGIQVARGEGEAYEDDSSSNRFNVPNGSVDLVLRHRMIFG